jgi:hypothetical protein
MDSTLIPHDTNFQAGPNVQNQDHGRGEGLPPVRHPDHVQASSTTDQATTPASRASRAP